MSTLTELVNSICLEMDEPIVSEDAVGSLATATIRRFVSYINNVYREAWGPKPDEYYPRVLDAFQTVVGQQAYTPNAAVHMKKMLQVNIRNTPTVLEKTELETYKLELNPYGYTTQGQPTHIFEQNKTLCLWPYPNDAYVIEVLAVRQFVPLAAPTDVPVLPEEFMDVLHWGALATAKLHERDPDADRCAQQFKSRLMDLRAEEIAQGPVYEATWVGG